MRAALVILALVALAPTTWAAQLSSEQMAAGKKLAARKCVSCHKMYDPAAYNAEQWDHWMGKMKRKARLKDDQFDRLARYFEALRERSPAVPSLSELGDN